MSFDMNKVGRVPCKNEKGGKSCPFGNKCSFLHGGESREECVARLTEARKTKVVKTEDKRWTVVCKTYEEHGVCPYGNRCHFAHCEEADLPVWRLWKLYKNEVEEANKFSSPKEAADFETSVQNMAANFGGENIYYIRFIGPKTAEEIGDIIYHSGGYSSSDIVVDNDNGVAFGYTEVMGKEGMPDKFVAEKDGVKLLMTRWVNKATKAKHELKEFVDTALEEADRPLTPEEEKFMSGAFDDVISPGEEKVPEEDLTEEEERDIENVATEEEDKFAEAEFLDGFEKAEMLRDVKTAVATIAAMGQDELEKLWACTKTFTTEVA